MKNEKQILYIDDEVINLRLFEMNFNKKYSILTCTSGAEALNILDKNPNIVIIVTDMRMPHMNGLEFIEKANAKFPDKKYFILTGYQITKEITAAIELGLAVKYFSKPFNEDHIDKVFSEIIKPNKN